MAPTIRNGIVSAPGTSFCVTLVSVPPHWSSVSHWVPLTVAELKRPTVLNWPVPLPHRWRISAFLLLADDDALGAFAEWRDHSAVADECFYGVDMTRA